MNSKNLIKFGLFLFILVTCKNENRYKDMVLISAGEFTMGSDTAEAKYISSRHPTLCSEHWFEDEQPIHKVWIDAFYIDKHEVTYRQFTKFIEATSYKSEGQWEDYFNKLKEKNINNLPIVGVSWNDANSYAKWKGKRLPTEAEWEKAMRGGREGLIYPWGNKIDTSKANFQNPDGPLPVGSYPPNGYGLYDMAGNAVEWCSDYYSRDYYKISPYKNPRGPIQGEAHVVRGGGWKFNYAFFARCAWRSGNDDNDTTNEANFVGFRCAYSPK